MKLTNLGKRLVAPEAEGEDLAARREAIMKPKVLRDFFEKYRRAKFPNDLIASNVLKSMSLPADRVASGLEIIKDNGRYAGIIRETPSGAIYKSQLARRSCSYCHTRISGAKFT